METHKLSPNSPRPCPSCGEGPILVCFYCGESECDTCLVSTLDSVCEAINL